jgi:CheY-like chemotaxis protein
MAATTIIAIDDDRSARETVVVAVERLNERRTQPLELLLARTGLEGINVLRVQPATSVGLVILDIHLPGADIDGRLIGPFIRETFPDLPILPFTGDRDTTVAAQLVALGMEPPVIKPIAPDGLAERIAHSLTSRQKTVTSPVPLQPFLADQARQLVGLLQQRRDAQTIHVALFAQDHLALSGLQHIVSDLVAQQLLAISIASRQATPIVEAIRANQVDLLLCAPDALTDAARITATHGDLRQRERCRCLAR